MEKPFVLIIEDERDTAALFRFVIEMAGYRTEIITHGQVAVERLASTQPDLVVLDLSLPVVSGRELLVIIRKDPRLRHTRVIVITAHSHIAETLSAEPDLVLYKPLNIDELSTIIRRFTTNERLQKTIPIRGVPWDKVTGLYTKTFFVNRLDSLMKQAQEIDKFHYAVLSLNLDPNNKLEGLFTPAHWESILHGTAQSLKSALRPTDTIARFYQNEFYCLVENIPDADIPLKIAERIQKRVSEAFDELGNKTNAMVRIGILLCDRDYASVEEVLRDAESAQRQANAQEASAYKFFDRTTIKG